VLAFDRRGIDQQCAELLLRNTRKTGRHGKFLRCMAAWDSPFCACFPVGVPSGLSSRSPVDRTLEWILPPHHDTESAFASPPVRPTTRCDSQSDMVFQGGSLFFPVSFPLRKNCS
jgi:hypothetical protein